MPIVIEGARTPPRLAEMFAANPRSASLAVDDNGAAGVRLALVNNMPDAALEETEFQFLELLNSIVGETPVRVKLYSLPEYARTGRAQQHVKDFYFDMVDFWSSEFDALIVTGTEPQQPNLQDEPYWKTLTDVLDSAARNTRSVILSCLAAHASVLHFDGIERQPLNQKLFGVFEFVKSTEHPLLNKAANSVSFPHSRWNGLRREDLAGSGYKILTESRDAGVNSFVKQNGNSLFLHLQGHPEYGARTLLHEYVRDVKRYLREERDSYPPLPHGYFDDASARLLNDFQENAEAHRQNVQMDSFPSAAIAYTLENKWRQSAQQLYRNWLNIIQSGRKPREERRTFSSRSKPAMRAAHAANRK